jgi:hypothetical protein
MRIKSMHYPCCHSISLIFSLVRAHCFVGECFPKCPVIWVCDNLRFLQILEKGGNFSRKRWRVLLICLSRTLGGVEDQFCTCQKKKKKGRSIWYQIWNWGCAYYFVGSCATFLCKFQMILTAPLNMYVKDKTIFVLKKNKRLRIGHVSRNEK